MAHMNNLDLNGNQILNVRAQVLASDPGSPSAGQFWYNSTINRLKYYDGSSVITLTQSTDGTLTGITGSGPISATDNGDGTYTISISLATTAAAGAMSAADKTKLDTAPADIGAALDGKADIGHTHDIADVTGLATALDGKSDDGHTHVIADVTGLQAALDSKIDESREGVANGIATLDAQGKVPSAQLPPIAISEVHVVADDAARDALTVEEGDVAKVTSTGKTWIYDGASWVEMTATSAVDSVNGQTGTVSLDAQDVGALEASQNLADLPNAGTARSNLGLGTAATLNVAASGDAAAGEVVKGDDSRLVPAKRYAANIGNGALTQIDVVHNLGTEDVIYSLRDAAGNKEFHETTVRVIDANTLRLTFAVAPTTNQLRVVVLA